MGTKWAHGLSLLEALIVIAVLGALLAIGVPRLSTPAARMFANDIKAQIEQARFEAIKRNAPVAVVLEATSQTFVTRLDPSDASVTATCSGDLILQERDTSDYKGVAIDTEASTWSGAVVWLPSGQGRACNGSPSIGGEIVVVDGSTTRRVELTVGGRVNVK